MFTVNVTLSASFITVLLAINGYTIGVLLESKTVIDGEAATGFNLVISVYSITVNITLPSVKLSNPNTLSVAVLNDAVLELIVILPVVVPVIGPT